VGGATLLAVRLFVAVNPPATAIAELRAATAPLRAGHDGLRWTRPEQWHLTLAFLGEVAEPARADLVERLGRVARRHPPLTLSLGDGGRFGHRVLWTRVRGDTERLRRLADAVRAAARRARIPVEDRPYRAHLTLARCRDDTDLRPAVAALAAFDGEPWTADELHLVRSELGAGPDGGARHAPLASWPLSGAGPPPPGPR
jgi:2'-5' RNA ligase